MAGPATRPVTTTVRPVRRPRRPVSRTAVRMNAVAFAPATFPARSAAARCTRYLRAFR